MVAMEVKETMGVSGRSGLACLGLQVREVTMSPQGKRSWGRIASAQCQ